MKLGSGPEPHFIFAKNMRGSVVSCGTSCNRIESLGSPPPPITTTTTRIFPESSKKDKSGLEVLNPQVERAELCPVFSFVWLPTQLFICLFSPESRESFRGTLEAMKGLLRQRQCVINEKELRAFSLLIGTIERIIWRSHLLISLNCRPQAQLPQGLGLELQPTSFFPIVRAQSVALVCRDSRPRSHSIFTSHPRSPKLTLFLLAPMSRSSGISFLSIHSPGKGGWKHGRWGVRRDHVIPALGSTHHPLIGTDKNGNEVLLPPSLTSLQSV